MKYIKGYLPKKKTGKGRVRKYNVMEDYEVVGRVLVDNQGSRSPYSISYRNDDESISFEGTLYKIYKKAKASGRNYVSHYDMRLSYINHDFIGNDDDYEEKYMFQSKDQWGGIIDAIDFSCLKRIYEI